MRSEREVIRVYHTLTCDWCGEQSGEFRSDAPPDEWLELKLPFDLESYFKEIPDMPTTAAAIGGSSVCHFDSESHMKIWIARNPFPNVNSLFTTRPYNEK